MLRVARIADPTGRYYLADLASELGPVTNGDRRVRGGGRWIGDGALGLGLSAQVDDAALGPVLSGRHPTRGHSLRQRETAVRAYDLTFAAPKSASVLFALGKPEASAAVRAAHEDAVEAATAYVALHAAAVRGSAPEGGVNPIGGLVAASFTHGVSRALDPHLHSHVVVANLARGDDGRWRAIDGRGLYAHARAAGALYDAVLRHGVTARLRMVWTARHPRGWELSAVDPILLGALSGRRAEILDHLGVHSRWSDGLGASPSRRARAVAWAATREPKPPVPPGPDELRARWSAVARDVGCTAELATQAPRVGAARSQVDEHRFAAAIHEAAPRGVARRDALRAWAGALATGSPLETVGRCVDALCDWGPDIGVAERVHPPAVVVPPPHVQRALGPRPASLDRLGVWLNAAESIDRYRARWNVLDRWKVLGADSRAELAAMPARRLSEHLSTARTIDDALARLGRTRENDRRIDAARALVRDGP